MEIAFGILVSRFRILLSTMVQGPKVLRDIVIKEEEPTHPTHRMIASKNKQMLCVADENCMDP